MGLTAAEANVLLDNPQYQTLEGLLDLVRRLSIETPADGPGKLTLLYSGRVAPDGTTVPGMGDIATYIHDHYASSVRVIDSTEAAKFLSDKPFSLALKNIFPDNDAARNAWLYDATKGPWAVLSERFVAAAQGPIESLTPFAADNRTFALVEVPTALKTPGVPSIHGIPRESLVKFTDSLVSSGMSTADATSAARELLSFGSRAETQAIDVAWQWTPRADGTQVQRITWVDSKLWTGMSADPATVPAGATRTTLGEMAGPLTLEQYNAIHDSVGGALVIAGNNVAYWKAIKVAEGGMGVLGSFLLGYTATKAVLEAKEAYDAGDTAHALQIVRDWSFGTLGAAAAGGVTFSTAAAVLAPLALLGPIGIGGALLGAVGSSLLASYWGHEGGVWLGSAISDLTATTFTASQSFIPIRRDPLILDLDNDGLEAVGPTQSGVLFDHDADGIKTTSGWVKADDGFLVMDRNNNGAIDNGRELFGDATLLNTGGTAADGFAALAQEDGNGDGAVNNRDANWNNLRVWRHLNQDGVSQTDELVIMADAATGAGARVPIDDMTNIGMEWNWQRFRATYLITT